MDNKKEIVVLSGGGHKGIVRLQSVQGKQNHVKGSCNLDFRPNNAKLYLVADEIAEIALNDTNTAFEVPFCAKDNFSCVVRSSSLIMFGGRGTKSKTLAEIDAFNKKKAVERTSERRAETLKNVAENQCEKQTDACEKENGNSARTDVRLQEETVQNLSFASEWTRYDGNNFYYAVKPQIDELFVRYPEETALNEAVENSRWVRIATSDDYYVVGVLFNENEPSFICYGVPSQSKTTPPDELENACVWLPVGDDENGYWVIYQSARNGSIVK